MSRKFYLVIIPLVAAAIAIPLSQTKVLRHLEFMSYDTILEIRPEYGIRNPEVVVVGITQQDINLYGKPPWSRRIHAELINTLHRGGAKVIAFDMFFPSPSPSPDKDSDRAFAEALQNAGNVILAVFSDEFHRGIETKKYKNREVYIVKQLTENLDLFKNSCWNQGNINVLSDSDDVLREVPLLVFHKLKEGTEKTLYSLGFLSFLKYKNIDRVRFEKGYVIAGNTRIPVDKHNNVRINYSKSLKEKENDFTFPISWVLSGAVPPSTFKDKIVLVGQIARGLPEADVVNTPFGIRDKERKFGIGTRVKEKEFGIMIYVHLINSLLRKRFLYEFPFPYYLSVLFIFSLVTFWVVSRFKFLGALFLTLGLVASTFFTAMLFMNFGSIVFPIIPFAVTAVLNLSSSTFISVKMQDLLIEKKESQLQSIGELSHLVTTTQAGREGSLDTLVATIAQAMRGDACVLREMSEDKVLNPLVTYNESFTEKAFLQKDLRFAKECIKQNQPLNTHEVMRPTEGETEAKVAAIISPLKVENVPLGAISIYRKDDTPFSSDDLALFVTLSNQTAVALKNVQLYKNVQRLFLDSIRALSAAIDAKDPYTEGHSQRVTTLSVAVAKEMQLASNIQERIRLAAQFHDIGKIGVSEAILGKKGRLTDEEYEEMKKHPDIGAGILIHVHELRDVIPGMKFHHERYDGRGYPEHLKEEQIPLFARVIGVADSFDAMTSDRPYRKGMSLDIACEEIKKNVGTQFDPKAAEAFLKLIDMFEAASKRKGKKTSVKRLLSFIESS